jgi:hypothetical protein
MSKRTFAILPLLFVGIVMLSQDQPVDTSKRNLIKDLKSIHAADSTVDYDLLLQDMESFLDSMMKPRSYFMGSLAFGKGYYNMTSKTNSTVESAQRFTYSPTLGYFHKSGLSIATIANIINDSSKLNLYQFSLSPGYDYLENKDFATGITFTRYFTKDSLSFYTTPLQNEFYTYFIYRKWWLKPMIALSYGWGSRSDYKEREALIQDLRLRRRGIIQINSKESISDFTLITSVRHDFYWLNIFSYKDHLRLTPQFSFISGTQKFGFNQSATTYATVIRTGANILYNSEDVYLDDQLEFQPLSLTLFLRGEYSIGKFFMQPQLIFDYYFPSIDKKFNTLFSINFGFVF